MSDEISDGPNSGLWETAGHDDQQFYDLVEEAIGDPDKIDEFIGYYHAIDNPETKARIRSALRAVIRATASDSEIIKSVTLH